MLSRLLIRNYAIIEEVNIQFTERLNIITGETGAGKSILVGALGLVLGERADTSVLQDKNKKAVVEAYFGNDHLVSVSELLKRWDIDADGEIILRREIGSNGKSRAFINDTPVNLNQLQQLAALLVDLHQQFDTRMLGSDDFQLSVLDSLAANAVLKSVYSKTFSVYEELRKKLQTLKDEQAAAGREFDFHRFLLDELQQADLKTNEVEELSAELKTLSHAEQIKSVLGRVGYMLQESEQPLLQHIRTMVQQLGTITSYHPDVPRLTDRMQSAFLELQDIAAEIESVNEKIQMDSVRIDEVQQRISLAQKLFKKHQVTTTDELLIIQEKLNKLVMAAENSGEEIQRIEGELKAVYDEAYASAVQISQSRKKQVPMLEKKSRELLKRIGMPNAALLVQLKETTLYAGGIDEVVFLFDANKTGRFEPLEKVASGGELSRLMLSLKSLVAHSLKMPTLIFDEIDSGISGEAARQVGLLMKELGMEHQVISITHQPQIAARADAHYYVFKKDLSGQIKTQITRLDQGERIQAIAKMLGGETPSAVALENAREMVEG